MDILHRLHSIKDFPMEIIVIENKKQQCEPLHRSPNLLLIQNLKLEEPPRILISNIEPFWFTPKICTSPACQPVFAQATKYNRSSHPP
jgi:hypothetical protein